MRETAEKQVSLFPKNPKPPVPLEAGVWLEVDKLPSTEGIEPDTQFIDDVVNCGILFPILLRKQNKRPTQLVDGRRRLAAARKLGIEKVRCDVYAMSASISAILTLVANFQRSSNPPSELAAMEKLLSRQGVTPESMAHQLGIPLQTIEKRLKLKALIPELREAFDTYIMATGVAEAAARLETARQMALLPILQDNGKITMADVKAQLQVKKKEAGDSLPGEMFDEPKPEVVKVEREVLEDAGEKCAYAAETVKTLANECEDSTHDQLVDDLEALARKLRVLAAE